MVSKVTIRAELLDEVSSGLRRITGAVESSVSGIGRAFDNLLSRAGRLTAIAGGISLALVGREAIQEARAQTEAERRLLEALQGRVQVLERIKSLAADLQRTTGVGDDVTLSIAADLLAAGRAAETLDEDLKAVLDTSVALGVSTDQVVQAISAFSINQAGLLTRRAPFLKQIQEEGRLAADGVNELRRRSDGVAAAVAATPFGQAEVQAKRYGDALETLGEVLVRLRVAAFTPIVAVAERVNRALELPVVRTLVNALEEAAPAIARFGLAIAAIGTAGVAIQGIVFAFGPIVAILGSVLSLVAAIGPSIVLWGAPLGIALTILGSLLSRIGFVRDAASSVAGAFATVRTALMEAVGPIGEIVEGLRTGRLTASDLFDILETRLGNIGVLVQRALLDQVREFFGNAATSQEPGFVFARALLGLEDPKNIGKSVFEDGVEGALTDVSRFFQTLTAGIKTAANEIFVAPADQAAAQQQIIETFLAQQRQESPLVRGARALLGATEDQADAVAKVGAEEAKLGPLEAALFEIRQRNLDLTRRLEQAERDRAQAARDRVEQDIAGEEARLAELQRMVSDLRAGAFVPTTVRVEDLFDLDQTAIRDLIRRVGQGAAEGLSTLVESELDAALKDVKVDSGAIVELLRLSRELAVAAPEVERERTLTRVEAITRRISAAEQQAEDAQERRAELLERSVDDESRRQALALALAAASETEADNILRTVALNRNLLDDEEGREQLRKQVLDSLRDEREATTALSVAEQELIEARREALRAALAAGQAGSEADATAKQRIEGLVKFAEDARTRLDQRLQTISTRRDAGLIFSSDALEQERQAAAEFSRIVDLIQARLDALSLAAVGTEFEDTINLALRKLQELKQGVSFSVPESEFGQFVQGFEQGSREVIGRFGDLSNAGKQFGEQAVGGLARAFSAFFTETDKGFRQLVGQILKGLADILLQAAFLRTLGFLLPGAASTGIQESTPFTILNRGGIVTAFNAGGFVDRIGQGMERGGEALGAAFSRGAWVLRAMPARAGAIGRAAALAAALLAPAAVGGSRADADQPSAERSVARPVASQDPAPPPARRLAPAVARLVDRIGRATAAFLDGMEGRPWGGSQATPAASDLDLDPSQLPIVRTDGTIETRGQAVRRLERLRRARLALDQDEPEAKPPMRREPLAPVRRAPAVEPPELADAGRRRGPVLAEAIERLEAIRPGAAAPAGVPRGTIPRDASLEPVAHRAGAFAGGVARGLERAAGVAGAAGLHALALLGGLGILGTEAAPVERHAIGGIAGAPLVSTAEGFVPGQRGPDKDSVLAYLTVGEAVIRRPAVDYYSRRVFRALNERLVPPEVLMRAIEPYLHGVLDAPSRKGAYQTGGFAGEPSQTAASAPVRSSPASRDARGYIPVLTADETTLERMLAGGAAALKRHMRQERDDYRGLLGIHEETTR